MIDPRAALAVVAVVLVAGCLAPMERAGLFDGLQALRFDPPAVPIADPLPGDCPDEPTTIEAGWSADCRGVVLSPAVFVALMEVHRQAREDTGPALLACYDLVDTLVHEGERAWQGCREELHVCRRNRARAEGLLVACGALHIGKDVAIGAAVSR